MFTRLILKRVEFFLNGVLRIAFRGENVELDLFLGRNLDFDSVFVLDINLDIGLVGPVLKFYLYF